MTPETDDIKDFASALAKVTSLDSEAMKVVEALQSGIDVTDKIFRILNIRSGYIDILNWLFRYELLKGGYTEEDRHLSWQCLNGISKCENELKKTCLNYIEDKVQTELLHFLFHQIK